MPNNAFLATATGLPKFTRRAFVRAAPATSLAILPVAGFAQAPAENPNEVEIYMQGFKEGQRRILQSMTNYTATRTDPILPLYQEWRAAREEWSYYAEMPGNEDWKWPESLATSERADAAFFKIIEMTPVTIEGIAALAHVYWEMNGPCSIEGSERFKEECELSENKLIAAIWRYAAGKGGLPV